MTLIEAVRAFMRSCPYLNDTRLGVDFLGPDVGAYSVDAIPTNPIVKRYMDGSSLREYLFVVSSRNAYGAEFTQNLENLGFFERLSGWVEEQNVAGNLPDLGEGRSSVTLEVTTSGYALVAESNTARYQIQLRLLYKQGRNYIG